VAIPRHPYRASKMRSGRPVGHQKGFFEIFLILRL
jgi:hypothetical protein